MVQERTVPADDPALLEAFRRGDRAAFDTIVGRHRRTLYAVARRFLGTHEDADEATQQALVRAWRSRERFRGDAALSTWLVRIVINVAKTLHGSRRSAEPLDGMTEPVDPRAIVGRELDLAEAREQVRQAVAGLPDRQRQVVLLKVFSEMTYKEVAEVMELSEGAVKAHLHQAVANLRRRMAPELSR